MSVQLNSFSISPQLVESGGNEKEITVSWNGVVTEAADNPVKVRLKISPFQKIAFVSTEIAEEAEVEWEQDFEVNVNKDFSETVVVITKQPQGSPKAASIKMTLFSAQGGMPDDRSAGFQYK